MDIVDSNNENSIIPIPDKLPNEENEITTQLPKDELKNSEDNNSEDNNDFFVRLRDAIKKQSSNSNSIWLTSEEIDRYL